MKLLSGLALLFCVSAGAAGRFNVLFIAVDDLRPELGCYGAKQIQSPNIDRLAKRGLLFNRAYCQQAVCNPSRASLLTGRRPESINVLDLPTHFRDKVPDVVTLPQLFREQGYHVQGFGKIYHTGHGNRDDAFSWSDKVHLAKPLTLALSHGVGEGKVPDPDADTVADTKSVTRRGRRGGVSYNHSNQPPWEIRDVADDELRDGKIAENAINLMREVKGKPFFIAVGFLKPHLPFVAPKKYYDLYNAAKLPVAANDFHPRGAPPWTGNNAGELRAYKGVPKEGPIPPQLARELVHGYYACVSYMDGQVGRVLDELDRLGLREKTIVVLWGDHGWQLGEHGTWCKHTAYETSTRAPLIISVPGQRSAGKKTDALVELVDIYPTLAELCGLAAPSGLEGTSLKPLLDKPNRKWKSAAFSVWPKRIPEAGPSVGRAIRTDRYRLVEWTAEGKDLRELELYDHKRDPQENENLAKDPKQAKRVEALLKQLHAGWQAAVPK